MLSMLPKKDDKYLWGACAALVIAGLGFIYLSSTTEEEKPEKDNLFDTSGYLDAIGIDPSAELDASIGSLYLVVSHHAKRISYQNMDLHRSRITEDSKPLSLVPCLLYKKLVQDKRGGMCYESSELLFSALDTLGFTVSRIPTFPLNNMPFDPTVPSTHNILLVTLPTGCYIVDASYGYNGIRFPLKFSSTTSSEYRFPQKEKYRISVNKDFYQIDMWVNTKAEWFSLYRFDRPLTFFSRTDTEKANIGLMQHKSRIPIRDTKIKIGQLTDDGRIGFSISLDTTPKSAFMLYSENGRVRKKEYDISLSGLKSDVKSRLGLELPDAIMG